MSDQTRDYFAVKTGREFASAAMERVNDFYTGLMTSGRLQLFKRLYAQYHKGYLRGGTLQKAGEQEEYTTMHANHFRNIIQHLIVMTTSQRPSFEAHATNTDHKSQAQAIVGSGVVDYYNREKGMDSNLTKATENGIVYGEGETTAMWDAGIGEDYMAVEGGKVLKQGDVAFTDYMPINVIRDLALPSATKATWKIYRDFENKYDLAARFPTSAERILKITMNAVDQKDRWLGAWNWKASDVIPVYRLFHDRTPAVPQGRYALLVDGEAPLVDGALPYSFFPGFRLAPMEQDGTPFGYSIAYDLLPIQEAIDILYSTVLTNQSNFGVQNILMPDGANISAKQLVDGLNLITYDPKQGKPESLNLTFTPAEIFNFIRALESLMETIAGINSVTRGNPEASLKSGAALALVQSMAIQFNSGLQRAYTKQAEGIGTALVKILSRYANTPRMVEIAGKSNRSYMKQFKADDLQGISRVTVDLGNPLARTTAGKLEIAENLLDKNLIESADQYIQVLTTGRLEPLTEGKQAELMLIRAENEDLSEGKPVAASVIDTHVLHIGEHKVVLASPEARINPSIVKNTVAHIQEHINMLQTLSVTNPNLLVALGQTPVKGGTPAPGPTPPPMPSGGPAPAPVSEVASTESPITKAAAEVRAPSMPENPLTGAQFSPQTGGM